ncbi:MAG: hypothetical protein LBO65_10235 [Spirochaetaceae bacterium]|jgi:tetratricopeptide (TPR) repeat protein|nr:hypothetical protein [Spirochaetaceae bacterium]
MKKKLLLLTMLAAALTGLYAQNYRDRLPPWLLKLRDAVYEQVLRAEQIYPLYANAKDMAAAELSGIEQRNALSRCEYLMGRAYQYFSQNVKAIECYQRGLETAEQSLSLGGSAEGWTLRSSNLSQLCTLRSTAWAIAHGLDVSKFAENALKINPRDAAARHIVASRWVYAPAPFNDTKKGIAMMKEILSGNYALQKDDLFNVYTALAYGYAREKNDAEARVWIGKALAIYPTNKFVKDELPARTNFD